MKIFLNLVIKASNMTKWLISSNKKKNQIHGTTPKNKVKNIVKIGMIEGK